jgi:myo-inositol-1-phosphate synthase
VPLNLECKLEVWDSPNSAAWSLTPSAAASRPWKRPQGALTRAASYFMKSPPVQYTDDELGAWWRNTSPR